MVGRTDKLWVLQQSFLQTVMNKQPHMVTVLGVPGIGKSRLLAEYEASLKLGGNDFLAKPFALEELEARLMALVRRARGAEHHRNAREQQHRGGAVQSRRATHHQPSRSLPSNQSHST